MKDYFGCIFPIFFMIFGVIQIYAAFLGYEDWLGWGWAVAIIVLVLVLRTSLPIVIGAFLGALNVWEWHWFWCVCFAAPMLILVVPSMVASVFEPLFARKR